MNWQKQKKNNKALSSVILIKQGLQKIEKKNKNFRKKHLTFDK